MRILQWNCNLALKKKIQAIEHINAEIMVFQECENAEEDFFDGYRFFWTGRNDNKGLGVLIKDTSARLHASFQSNFIYFLPIETDEFNILAVWAFNHRAAKFGDGLSGKPIDALEHYEHWLKEKDQSFVIGDFNNSVVWDKPGKLNNFTAINQFLESLSFKSAYHQETGDTFGREATPTLYHTKQKSKSYHIDYIYQKGFETKFVEVFEFEDWISLRDHVPICGHFEV